MDVRTLSLLCLLLLLLPPGSVPAARGIDCKPGCNDVHGFCEAPGECRCHPGWQGELCEQCVPFPGCLHGTCASPWQCVCQEGWVGILCDRDIHPCAATPCENNSTCIETGDGGHICLCAPGFTGKRCHVKKGPCLTNGSPCQNGGTCVDANGFAPYASCQCLSGFSGNFCEIGEDHCEPNPCKNGGICSNAGPGFRCQCPSHFTGESCRSPRLFCVSNPCRNEGTCHEHPVRGFVCTCPPDFTGETCTRYNNNTGLKPVNAGPKHGQSHHLPPNTNHNVKHHKEHEVLKITVKETIQHAHPFLNKSQVICFIVLGLLTCLVVLVTTGIVFFSKCETWLANAKYSHLLQKQKKCQTKSSSGEELSVKVIYPEKINTSNHSKSFIAI
ncbi:protein delta homolog 1 isoform X2 [Ambystoma mexicanum]|uniref:protein delta homolog 1 isoform X2 n=1 Tax=Ambystoma mexicanum TaxID=8296 RepID=UPI0037E83240